MDTIYKFIGWGYGSAYFNFIEKFPIMKEYFDGFIDRDFERKQNKSNCIYSKEILKDLDKNATLIVIFSQFYEEILHEIKEHDFKHVIIVWDIYQDSSLLLRLLDLKRDYLLRINGMYNGHDFNEAFVARLNQLTINEVQVGNLMRTEINHLYHFLINRNGTKLYEISTPEKLKLALIGNGEILVSSLMYNRQDHIQQMNEMAIELGKNAVTQLLFYDDFINMDIFNNEDVTILEYDLHDFYYENSGLNELIEEVLNELNYYISNEFKWWLRRHIEHAVSLIYLYQNVESKLKIRKAVFILDYYRDEYILASLMNLKNIDTYSMQHGFYAKRDENMEISTWEKIYYTHAPSKYRLVWGEKWKETLQGWGIKSDTILVTGNFKYKQLNKFKYNLTEVNNILLILNMNEKTNNLLIETSLNLKKIININNIYVKSHPESKVNLSLSNKVQIIKADFANNINEEFNIVLCSLSTVYFEMIMKNKLIFMNDALKILSDNPFSTFGSQDEMISLLDNYISNEEIRMNYDKYINKELSISFAPINIKFLL